MTKDVVDLYLNPILDVVLRKATGKVNKRDITLELESKSKSGWGYHVYVNNDNNNACKYAGLKPANKYFDSIVRKYNLKEVEIED